MINLDYFKSIKIKDDIVKNLSYEYFSGYDELYRIIGLAPRTKEDFIITCSFLIGEAMTVIHNNNENCIEHQLIIDAMWDSYSEIEDFLIWYAARGTGKTYDLSLLSFIETIYKPKCSTSIIGGSLEQAMRAVAYFNEFWEKSCIGNQFIINKEITSKGFRTIEGSWVKALAASPKSIRGEHPNKLRIDEADELDRKLYDASLGQPKAKNGHKDNVIISSTLHHPFGLMSEILDDVEKIGAKLYKWCIYDVCEPYGFWKYDEIERKKKQVTDEMWDSEYLCKRPKMGDSIFDFESISRAYKRGADISFESTIDSEGGIDWGYNCTVLNIIQDIKESFNVPHSYQWEQVELTERCNEIIDICIEKKINVIYCDSNPKDNYITLRKRITSKRAKISVIPIAFSVWKGMGIDVIRYLLKHNIINIKDYILQDKMKKYHYKDAEKEIIDKVDDHYPDALIAWAATKWRILGYLNKEEIEKLEKKEKNIKFNVGTY